MVSKFIGTNCAPCSLIYQLFNILALLSNNGKKQGQLIVHKGNFFLHSFDPPISLAELT